MEQSWPWGSQTAVKNGKKNQKNLEVFHKKDVPKKYHKVCWKMLENNCVGVFLNNIIGLQPAISLKKRPQNISFPVNFANIFTKTFLKNASAPLLLKMQGEIQLLIY